MRAAATPAAPAASGGQAVRRVFFLIGSQLVSRGFTFALNALVARAVGLALFGIYAVNLYLLDAFILGVAREGLRRAGLRFAKEHVVSVAQRADAHLAPRASRDFADMRQRLVNLCFAAPLAGVAVAVAAAHFSLTLMRPATEDPDFDLAVWLAALAAVVQLLGEPVYVLADACVMYRERAAIDSAANLVRCVATYWFVVQRRGGALGFALAQLAFAAAWTAGLYALAALRARDNALRLRARGPDAALVAPFITSFASVLPGRLIDDSSAHAGRAGLLERFTDGELARLTWAFTGQSLLKLVLTEGEKSVLALVNRARPDQQGVFALVSNLGSLVARMVLQPLEESSYNDLSALLARDPQGRPLGANHALQALALVALLLKLVGLMALSFVSFGPNYSFVLFDVVYGAAWSASEAPSLLSWYCVYLMFIAVNGISEAFLAAAVSESELKGGYNRWLVVCSTLYVVGAALLLRIGLVGAVLANCLNMAARIWYSAAFFGRFCVEHQVARPWSALGEASLPPLEVFAAFAAAALATRLSFDALHVSSCGRLFPCYAAHVTVGAVALLLVAAVVLLRDRRLVSECRRVWAGRKGD